MPPSPSAQRGEALERLYEAGKAMAMPQIGKEYDVSLRATLREGKHKGKGVETALGHPRAFTDALAAVPEAQPTPPITAEDLRASEARIINHMDAIEDRRRRETPEHQAEQAETRKAWIEGRRG